MARTMITLDDQTLTHLLGYLKPEAWKDALKLKHIDTILIEQLIKHQEKVYGYTMFEEETQE